MFFKKKSVPPPDLNYDAFNKDWYFDFLSRWNEILNQNSTDEELQIQYLDELSQRIKTNTNNRNLMLLNDTEVKRFWRGVKNNLRNIKDTTIIEYKGYYNTPLKHFLLELKDDRHLKIIYKPDDIIIKTKDGTLITKASERALFVEMMSYNKSKNMLTIMGNSTFPIGAKTESRLTFEINGTKKILKDNGLYADFKVFGKTVYHKFPFRIDIDLDQHSPPIKINFILESLDHSTSVPLKIVFNSFMSKLAGRITYWCFGDYVAIHNKKTLIIKNKSYLKTISREFVFLIAIGVLWRRPKVAILRTFYWLSWPVLGRRNIWLYMDKIYKGGDNAEYLYRYAVTQQDNAHHYYVLREDVPDARRFEEDGLGYLKYKSILQRLIFLHSKILVFTHSNAPAYYRYGGRNEVYFRNLYNYDLMYIQHGLTVQDTAWLYKKSYDDFKLYFVASKFEKDNLLRPEYGYKPYEIIKSGATRYDGLFNTSNKKIIVSPTWRTYIAPPGKDFGESRDPNKLFKNTDFYKIYNSLISDKKLASTAKKLGYEITFLLHPVLSSQISDFNQDGFVKIVMASDGFDYNEAMSEASLMITDYSGIQFDFAYTYKPIVYFHPPELPPSYDEANYQYKKHALGEITTQVDELVDLVCEYMENDCKIKTKYKKRIDGFFYHHDRNNSKRTYNTIVKWQQENQ